MDWSRLISDKRLGMERFHDPRNHTRSDFQRDYDRMVFSSPFRRLQNKTQVFPLPGSIFVHNRLTHSLEVASVGRSMAKEAALRLRDMHGDSRCGTGFDDFPDIVAAACLCHDLGNPPFGHSGEKTIATYFSEGEGLQLRERLSKRQWADLVNFEGNANSFRLLTHQFVGRRQGGFAMTYSTLAAMVKYPRTSMLAEPDHPKFGFIEDAHRLAILSLDEVASLFLGFFGEEDAARMRRGMGHLDDPNEKVGYLRSNVIGALVGDCARVFAENETSLLRGELEGSLIGQASPRLREGYGRCAAIARKKIYMASDVIDVEIAGNRIITYLLNSLMEAVIHPERNFSRLLLETVPGQYDIGSDSLYTRIQGVLDHVSGMTDVYALNLFRKLNGHSLPAV